MPPDPASLLAQISQYAANIATARNGPTGEATGDTIRHYRNTLRYLASNLPDEALSVAHERLSEKSEQEAELIALEISRRRHTTAACD